MKFSALYHHISTLFQRCFNLFVLKRYSVLQSPAGRHARFQGVRACVQATVVASSPSLPVRLSSFQCVLTPPCAARDRRDCSARYLHLVRATLRERSRNQLPDRHFSLIGSRSRPASGPDWRKPQSVHILRRTAQPDRTAGTTRMG